MNQTVAMLDQLREMGVAAEASLADVDHWIDNAIDQYSNGTAEDAQSAALIAIGKGLSAYLTMSVSGTKIAELIRDMER